MLKKITLLFTLFLILNGYAQQNYYNNVNLNLTGLALKEELSSKITSTHTNFLFYSEVWDASKITDINPNNNGEVLLIYGWEDGSDSDVTNNRTRGVNNNGGSVGDWNREHVYSRSLGTPNLGESGPGSDAHHLRPSDVQRNSSRNNRKFTEGSGNSGTQSNGGWYPGDEWKGDVARMMMYMYLRYQERCLPSNVGFGDNSNTPDDMIDLFLKWNAEDPVSQLEIQRNEYHGNTNNDFAQGNRNPFIDNPRLATRIWGGEIADDLWGIYSNNDNEAPSAPTNLTATNITTKSIDLSWNAATDNVEVTSYDIYVNNELANNTTNTTFSYTNLAPNTSYEFKVLAKDIANNTSEFSNVITSSTLEDVTPPTVPENITIANETTNSFIVSWQASSDDTQVSKYEIYLNGSLNSETSETSTIIINLESSTTYQIQIAAVDIVGNTSEQSNPISATTNGDNAVANELFFSEYVEGSSFNKAIEIVNLTEDAIDLAPYSIKRQRNGGVNGDGWNEDLILNLEGVIGSNDVFVIVSEDADLQILNDEADYVHPRNNSNQFGTPINFNGNDPVGLFKNNVLIDIIGTFNGGSSNFGENKTLRRKQNIVSPNTTFDIDNEWDVYNQNDVSDIGKHASATLSTSVITSNNFKIYPNPNYGNKVTVQVKEDGYITIYNVLGKKVYQNKLIIGKNIIDTSKLSKGVYLLKVQSSKNISSKKLIKR